MKLNLTVEEAIYILNRLKGRELEDICRQHARKEW